jgi:hypothetical protein
MADDAATTSSEESQVTFNVKAANDQKHVLTLSTAAARQLRRCLPILQQERAITLSPH